MQHFLYKDLFKVQRPAQANFWKNSIYFVETRNFLLQKIVEKHSFPTGVDFYGKKTNTYLLIAYFH